MNSKSRGTGVELSKYLDEKFKTLSEDIKDLKNSVAHASDKVENVSQSIGEINVTIARQEEQLAYHIKRTDLLEEDLRPVKNHVDLALKLGGAFMFIVSIIAGVAQIMQWYQSK